MQQNCSAFSGSAHLLRVIAKIDTITYELTQKIDFRCNYNQCNSKKNLLALQQALKEHHNLSSLRKDPPHTSPATSITDTITVSSMISLSEETASLTSIGMITEANIACNRNNHSMLQLISLALLVLLAPHSTWLRKIYGGNISYLERMSRRMSVWVSMLIFFPRSYAVIHPLTHSQALRMFDRRCVIASPVWESSNGSVLRLYLINWKDESTKWTVEQMNEPCRYLSDQIDHCEMWLTMTIIYRHSRQLKKEEDLDSTWVSVDAQAFLSNETSLYKWPKYVQTIDGFGTLGTLIRMKRSLNKLSECDIVEQVICNTKRKNSVHESGTTMHSLFLCGKTNHRFDWLSAYPMRVVMRTSRQRWIELFFKLCLLRLSSTSWTSILPR